MGRGIATLAAALACALGAHAQSPEDLRAMLDKGDARGAYEAGRRAPQRLGEPAFDLVFGIAAVNAGHVGEGVLALERFLLLEPTHEGARVELARGYFLLGDDVRAREEFEAALARNPPPPVARIVHEHLAALRERESRYRPTATAWLEAGGGYDSNPRAGVDNPVISLPVLGEVTVAETGVRVSDRTLQYGAGFRATVPVSARAAAFASGQAQRVRHADESDFDQSIYAGSVGIMGQWRKALWRGGAALGYQTLADAPYRRTHGAFFEAGLPLDERHLVTLGAQGGKLDYHGDNNVRDSDFEALSLGWRTALASPWRPQLEAGLNAGRERNRLDDRQDLSRDLHGARLGVALAPLAGWTLGAGATWQRSRYREPDPLLETTREDRYVAGDLAIGWNAWRALTLRVELTDARNESNLAIYEYRRRTAIVRGRYEFR